MSHLFIGLGVPLLFLILIFALSFAMPAKDPIWGSQGMEFLVWLDRWVNKLLRGSFNETLSSRAHRMRVKKQPYWGWLADAIDLMFLWQTEHCASQWQLEVKLGWHD